MKGKKRKGRERKGKGRDGGDRGRDEVEKRKGRQEGRRVQQKNVANPVSLPNYKSSSLQNALFFF